MSYLRKLPSPFYGYGNRLRVVKWLVQVEANLVLDLGFLTSISALFPLVLAASLLAGDKTAVGRALPP